MKAILLNTTPKTNPTSFYIKLAQLLSLSLILIGLLAFNSQKLQAQMNVTICAGESAIIHAPLGEYCLDDAPQMEWFIGEDMTEALCLTGCSNMIEVSPTETTVYISYTPAMSCEEYVPGTSGGGPIGPAGGNNDPLCGTGSGYFITDQTPAYTYTITVTVEDCTTETPSEISTYENVLDLNNESTEGTIEDTRRTSSNTPTINTGDWDLEDVSNTLEIDLGKTENGTLEILPQTSVVLQNMKAYPNPTIDFLYLDLEANISTAAQIQLIDLLGNVLQMQDIRTQVGNNHLTLDLNYLASGIYYVVLQVGEEMISRKIHKL